MSLLRSPRVCSLERETVFAGLSMKWMLVVLVGGMTPVQTDVPGRLLRSWESVSRHCGSSLE